MKIRLTSKLSIPCYIGGFLLFNSLVITGLAAVTVYYSTVKLLSYLWYYLMLVFIAFQLMLFRSLTQIDHRHSHHYHRHHQAFDNHPYSKLSFDRAC